MLNSVAAAASCRATFSWRTRESSGKERAPRNGVAQKSATWLIDSALQVAREALLRRLLTLDRTTEKLYARKRAQFIAEFNESRKRNKEKIRRVGDEA